MIIKIIANIILIIGLGLIQISFISGLPGGAGYLNLALVVLIFILGFGGFDFALWWALGLGWLLETFSFLPFGILLVSLCLTISLSNLLLNYFFTNRSLYSFLALTALATLAYKLIISLSVLIFAGVFSLRAEADFWPAILIQIGFNLAAAFFIFYFIHFLSRSFKPVFLLHPVK